MRSPVNHEKPIIQMLQLNKCLAKTIKTSDGLKIPGITVETHCAIVGSVARELLSRMPGWLRANLFPQGCALIAAVHDLGKVSPGFQQKIYKSCGINLSLDVPENLDKIVGYHWAVSQAALEGCGNFIPEIAGRHHGMTPNAGMPNDEAYGGPGWQKVREELLNHLKIVLSEEFPTIVLVDIADVLSGLTTVADWIGSGSLFDGKEKKWQSLVSSALDNAGFIPPRVKKGLTFSEVFQFPPRDAQLRLIESVQHPGAYVIEAPMGLGKTEAALYAAYKALEENRATGIYFALPTQLTSDKIHERMKDFLKVILADDCKNKEALLLHGSAWLAETELGEDGSPGKSWFNSAKRGLLAPFAVGTIDQALMAVMNVKHGFVRTFGLAGKVVILDEVHSYDSYTGTILDALVKKLQALSCTVIILSATLTAGRRSQIIGSDNCNKIDNKSILYPLITAFPKDGTLSYHSVEREEDANVKIKIEHDDNSALEEAYRRAEMGQQVLWIENTVRDAQDIFKTIAARTASFGVDCGLIHSRYTKIDREKNETKWVNLFGKTVASERYKKGRILVGTQVLEQSLDIDADFLISRIAPTDMLFQRIGRLWRHRENDTIRPVGALREAWIISPTLNDCIMDQGFFGNYGKVYAPYVLCRTIAVWSNCETVALPGDIREMLEATYVEKHEEGNLANYLKAVIDIREKLSRLARIGLSKGGTTLPESKAATRYSELESGEVLIINSIQSIGDGVRLRLMDDTILELPKNAKSLSMRKQRHLAAILQRHIVRVPDYLLPQTPQNQLRWLEEYMYIGYGEESPVAVVKKGHDGVLRGFDGSETPLPNYSIDYDPEYGYIAQKTR
jgi:CRISPR-associated endonuclease/helicase Cas3